MYYYPKLHRDATTRTEEKIPSSINGARDTAYPYAKGWSSTSVTHSVKSDLKIHQRLKPHIEPMNSFRKLREKCLKTLTQAMMLQDESLKAQTR